MVPVQQELHWQGASPTKCFDGRQDTGSSLWAEAGLPQGCGDPCSMRPSLFCWRLDFYSGRGTLGQGRARAPAQSTAAGRGSRLVYISLAVICINLLRSEPGFPHGQAGRMVVRLDRGALCYGSPTSPAQLAPLPQELHVSARHPLPAALCCHPPFQSLL